MNLSGNKLITNNYIFLDFLKALVYLTMLLCDALAFKVVSFPYFGFGTVAASGIIFIFSFAFMNTISNVYGFEHAKRTLYTTLILQAVFCVTVSLVARMPSATSSAAEMAGAYFSVFHQSYRVIFSSTIGVFTGFYLNSVLVSIYKRHFFNKNYLLVYFFINSISKAWLVIVSYTINYSSILGVDEMLQLMYQTWLFKISLGFAIVFVLTPFLILLAKKIDCRDVVDVKVSYVPYPLIKNNYGKDYYKVVK